MVARLKAAGGIVLGTTQVDGQALATFEATASTVTPFPLTVSPVVVLPSGIEDGLPLGLQYVGKRWQHEALLSVCETIESASTGGVVPPLRQQ